MTAIALNAMTPTSAVPMTVIYKDRPVKLMARDLFTAKSFKCWEYITEHESHFNPNAVNPTSGARGIGQLLPSTMKSLGLNVKNTNANAEWIGQIAYLSRHFGSVCSAASYWKKHFNY